jgi:sugar phosphate isomerase/epimerase
MTWKDQLREVATNLGGATGIEIISEGTIPHYPMPPESFYFDWNNEMARWGLKAVTMDCYLDVMQFRDHIMNHAETAERLKYDLRIAKRMGFENIRLVHNVPHESIAMALPLAEELNVRMTNEIHAPQHIRPKLDGGIMFFSEESDWGYRAAADVAFIQKHNTKHYGLQPDMGIFQYRPGRVEIAYMFRQFMNREDAEKATADLIEKMDDPGVSKDAVKEYIEKKYPALLQGMMGQMVLMGCSAEPEDLFDIAPYIFCIHGKFTAMVEIPGEPGHYKADGFRYDDAIKVLKAIGYEGYIDSEYEGQRSQQDMDAEHLPDEVEEVRRHHEMMKRLIGE